MLKLFFVETSKERVDSDRFARKILGEYLGVNKNELIIERDDFGKPYLKNYPHVFFNLSHTKGMMVCAISDAPVGVDIEREERFNRRIAEKFFTTNEQIYIFSGVNNLNKRFCEIWTKKEAYVKWLGLGMGIPFKSFDVLENDLIVTYSYGKYVYSYCTGFISTLPILNKTDLPQVNCK